MSICCFWNNKGGTGKTSLAFQALCRWAEQHPQQQVLAIDMCPQANLSELLLGGLTNDGADNLLRLQGQTPRATIGGYFQLRLPSAYTDPKNNSADFVTKPSRFNAQIPDNVDLVCGEPMLELQVNAMSTTGRRTPTGASGYVHSLTLSSCKGSVPHAA